MIVLVAVAFGLVFGSFACAMAGRLAAGRSITGRSRCDGCERPLGPLELIPLLSYALLRGRCAGCGSRIGLAPLVVEAGFGAAFGAAFLSLDAGWAAALCAAMTGACIITGSALKRERGDA
jgi:leader peptidase (prepilin peptidase)/N-methyltransferase